MKAMYNDKVIAEADKDDLISIDGAWYYPKPMDGAPKKVGHDFTNYVAFSGYVKVSE